MKTGLFLSGEQMDKSLLAAACGKEE